MSSNSEGFYPSDLQAYIAKRYALAHLSFTPAHQIGMRHQTTDFRSLRRILRTWQTLFVAFCTLIRDRERNLCVAPRPPMTLGMRFRVNGRCASTWRLVAGALHAAMRHVADLLIVRRHASPPCVVAMRRRHASPPCCMRRREALDVLVLDVWLACPRARARSRPACVPMALSAPVA